MTKRHYNDIFAALNCTHGDIQDMSATEPLFELLGWSAAQLSQEERMIFEAETFFRFSEEFMSHYKQVHQQYFKLLKSETDKETNMLDADFTRLIIKDILVSEEYTLDGIACYANTHKDVIYDVVMGYNASPSVMFVKSMIALHRTVRPELYQQISRKILNDVTKAGEKDEQHVSVHRVCKA